ncbi:MAG: hypothetical protein EBR02_03515 [Alphaproteobacteria bacterium]|nr:hypothetical protein [Alphaproteobacteria bacterium]
MFTRTYFLIGLTVLIAVLAWQYPHAIDSTPEKARLMYLSIWAILISGSALLTRRLPKEKFFQYGLVWTAIFLALMVGYKVFNS